MIGQNKMPVPDTVGQLVEILSKFPPDTPFDLSKLEVYDNGSEYETDCTFMKLNVYGVETPNGVEIVAL